MRDTRTAMPPVDASADSLRIWHCRYKTLNPVGRLKELRTLVVATYPDDSLALLRPLQKLQYLRILHLPKIRDLSPLKDLQRLESLSLETLPSWDPSEKVTEVESLEPLASLPALKHVALFGVVSKTRSLLALQQSRSLISAQFTKYPKAEMNRFYEETSVVNQSVPKPPS